jgi:hypothetical protein
LAGINATALARRLFAFEGSHRHRAAWRLAAFPRGGRGEDGARSADEFRAIYATGNQGWLSRYQWFSEIIGDLIKDRAGKALDG